MVTLYCSNSPLPDLFLSHRRGGRWRTPFANVSAKLSPTDAESTATPKNVVRMSLSQARLNTKIRPLRPFSGPDLNPREMAISFQRLEARLWRWVA